MTADTVYLSPTEDMTGPMEHVRMSAEMIRHFEREGEIERVVVHQRRRDGRLKQRMIWRVTNAMFKHRYDVRGESCRLGTLSVMERVIERLVAGKPCMMSSI